MSISKKKIKPRQIKGKDVFDQVAEDFVSESFWSRNPEENENNSGNKRTAEQKEKDRLQVIFDTVDDFAINTKKIERFKDITLDRIRYGVFLAIPECQEVKKKEFWLHYKVNAGTLSVRRFEDDVQSVRDYILKAYFKSKTPKVIQNLYEAASDKGIFWVSTAAIKLFLQYIEEFSEKNSTDLNLSGGVTVQFWVGQSPFINPETTKKQTAAQEKEPEKPVRTVTKSWKTKKKKKPANKPQPKK